jgi:hypothetical protein
MEPRQSSPSLYRRVYEHAVGTETAVCLSSFGLAPVRTARRALVSVGPRAAEDLHRKPGNSLVKRFHGQREVGVPVQRTVMSDLTVDSSSTVCCSGEEEAIAWTFLEALNFGLTSARDSVVG